MRKTLDVVTLAVWFILAAFILLLLLNDIGLLLGFDGAFGNGEG